MSNMGKVESLYSAFGRGDIAFILSLFSESIEWGHEQASPDVPWLQPQRGRANVAKFFESFSLLQMNSFRPKTFLETGNVVVVLVDEDVTVIANGRRIPTQEQVHIWKFDAAGSIVAHDWHLDTHTHWLAYHAK